jgi:hypothetical protein
MTALSILMALMWLGGFAALAKIEDDRDRRNQ